MHKVVLFCLLNCYFFEIDNRIHPAKSTRQITRNQTTAIIFYERSELRTEKYLRLLIRNASRRTPSGPPRPTTFVARKQPPPGITSHDALQSQRASANMLPTVFLQIQPLLSPQIAALHGSTASCPSVTCSGLHGCATTTPQIVALFMRVARIGAIAQWCARIFETGSFYATMAHRSDRPHGSASWHPCAEKSRVNYESLKTTAQCAKTPIPTVCE